MTKPRHYKQHDARAASFKRIAKALRVHERNFRRQHYNGLADVLKSVATELDFEAKTLRSLR